MDIFFGKETKFAHLLKSSKKKQLFLSLRKNIEEKDKKVLRNLKKKNIYIIGSYPSKKINKLNYQRKDEFIKLSLKKNFEILNLINKKTINKIFFFSSSAVISLNNGLISRYNDNKKIYSLGKKISELFLIDYCKRNNISLNIFRIFNLYHENDQHTFLNRIKENQKLLIENKDDVRDFIHIDDAAKIIKKIAIKKTKKFQIFDIGTGRGYRIKDLLQPFNLKKKLIKQSPNRKPLISVANIEYLKKQKIKVKFKNIESYLKLDKKKKIISISNKLEGIIQNKENFQNTTVIYGCGNAGYQVHKLLKNSNEEIKLFVDDFECKKKDFFLKTNIVTFSEFILLTKYIKFKKIILAIPSLSRKNFDKIIKKLKTEKIFYENLALSKNKNDQINIEDLSSSIFERILKRKELILNLKELKFLNNRTVMITGGAGSIGGSLALLILKTNIKKLLIYDNSELNIYNLQSKIKKKYKKVEFILGDINDKNYISSIIRKNKISNIFHAAANKHVNITEMNPLEAIKTNIFGTLNVLQVSKEYNVHLTIISTDKATAPKSLLGYTKRFSELLNLYVGHSKVNILRFGNVIASNGSALPKWIQQVNNEEYITITSKKAKRYFMTINEACYLVLNTCKLKIINKIFILNMGKQIRIINIIEELVRLKKLINPFYKPKFDIIGLQKGEKLIEKLSLNKKLYSTVIQNVYYVEEPTYAPKLIENAINSLKKFNINGYGKKSKILLQQFLKKEK
jgi:FlaA1/EpsC-like NDP-sugar epimerase